MGIFLFPNKSSDPPLRCTHGENKAKSFEAACSCRAAAGRSAQRWRSIMMPPSEEQHSCAQRGGCCLSLSVNMPFSPRPPPGSRNNRRSRLQWEENAIKVGNVQKPVSDSLTRLLLFRILMKYSEVKLNLRFFKPFSFHMKWNLNQFIQ